MDQVEKKTPDILPADVRQLLTAMEARSGAFVLAMRRDTVLLRPLLEQHYGLDSAECIGRRLLSRLDASLSALYSPRIYSEEYPDVVKECGGGVVLDLVDEVELTAVEDERRCMQVEEERAA